MKHLHDIPRETAPLARKWFGQMLVSTAPVNTYAEAMVSFDRYMKYARTWREPRYQYQQNAASNFVVRVRNG